MQDGSWLCPAWKHESLKHDHFKHHINICGFNDEFTEIIKRRSCKITATEGKKNRTFDGVVGEAEYSIWWRDAMFCTQGENSLFSLHTSWLMNKYEVISDSHATIKPRWIRSNIPASKQTRREVWSIEERGTENIQNFRLFGINQKIAKICMLPPVAELRITTSYITQHAYLVTYTTYSNSISSKFTSNNNNNNNVPAEPVS